MNRLDELERKLAAEVAAMRVSDSVEAALLREFSVRKRKRVWWVLPLAACLGGLGFWGIPRSASTVPPRAFSASVSAPSVPAASVKAMRAPRRRVAKKKRREEEGEFVRVPFSAPLGPGEGAEVVRMEIPVSALTAAGFEVATADAGATAQADVLIGRDGMAHAVRLISISGN